MKRTEYVSCWMAIPVLCPIVYGYAQNSPNVLIIHTDEHNFRTLGCYRSLLTQDQAEVWGKDVVVETPNIDFLATHGVICERFYATTPVSSPSRSSFMTGLYPQQTGVVTNDIPMNDTVVTFAEDFRRSGYHTGYLGKWHLDGTARPGWHPNRKFGFEDNRYMMNRGHYKRIVENSDGKLDITYEGKGLTPENFMTDFLTDKAIDYIRNHQKDKFCCVISYPDPHGPNIVRSPYDTMYTHLNFQLPKTALKNKDGLPSWAFGNDQMENMARYFGMVKCLDDNVGRLLRELKDCDLLEHTIIVFTSDHGDLCGEHGRTNKSVPLEASARVPFIIYYPEELQQGKVVKEVLSVVDFAPTILSLAGIKTTAFRAGRDFTILLKGKEPDNKWRDAVFMRGGDNLEGPAKSWISVVSKRYKLTLSDRPGDKPWLTDLVNDPDELINEYDNPSYRNILRKLMDELYDYGQQWKDKRLESPLIKKEMNEIVKSVN